MNYLTDERLDDMFNDYLDEMTVEQAFEAVGVDKRCLSTAAVMKEYDPIAYSELKANFIDSLGGEIE